MNVPLLPRDLSYQLAGIDCAGCARKIEAMAAALPGASGASVNFATQVLRLRLDEGRTQRAVLEANLREMGYGFEEQGAALPAALVYQLEGIDCAGCARKIEAMAAAHPGVSDAAVNFSTQMLSLGLDEAQTPRAAIEGGLRELGYAFRALTAAPAPAEGLDMAPPPAPAAPLPWYRGRQGQHILVTGTLLAAAFVVSQVNPPIGHWLWVAATVVGAVPPLRKALVLANFGEYFSIQMLMSLAAIGAVLIGEAEEGAIVVFLYLLGEVLEAMAGNRARAGIQALAALAPKTALLVEGDGTREVAAARLAIGHLVQVNPGARVPADGEIVAGTSALDDSPVTGESVPVTKTVGGRVYAGSINTSAVLRVRVDTRPEDNTIARIIHLIAEAEASRAPTARLIDRFSRVYTPIVVAIAVTVAVLPPLAGFGTWHDWLYKGLALLLIGCPCALLISVPAAITSGLSSGTRRGLLVKGGAALETIGLVRTIAFDKTGTLTAGRPAVTGIAALDGDEDAVLARAAAVERGSDHPLARAITAAAAARGLAVPAAGDAGAIAGKSAYATVAGAVLSVSSPLHARALLTPEAQARVTEGEASGHTVVVLHDERRALGLISIRDEARPDSAAAVAALKKMGVRPLMLTGDNARTGAAIAEGLGLEVKAQLLPQDKLAAIDALKADGRVAMVGDGINDAPALARADVGIAMGGGTDVALETADAALMREKVTGVAELVQLSRDVMNNIRWNIAIALGLKGLFLVTTLTGTTNLWMAILADTGATALVTLNAVRLLAWRPHGVLTAG